MVFFVFLLERMGVMRMVVTLTREPRHVWRSALPYNTSDDHGRHRNHTRPRQAFSTIEIKYPVNWV